MKVYSEQQKVNKCIDKKEHLLLQIIIIVNILQL